MLRSLAHCFHAVRAATGHEPERPNAGQPPATTAESTPNESAPLPAATQARLMKALRRLPRLQEPTRWCEASCPHDDLRRWQVRFYFSDGSMAASLRGAKRTFCELELQFPPDYPNQPPHVRVIAPQIGGLVGGVFGGALCLRMLYDWNPQTDEHGMLVHLHTMLRDGYVAGRGVYGRQEARKGEAHIRSCHRDWRPMQQAGWWGRKAQSNV